VSVICVPDACQLESYQSITSIGRLFLYVFIVIFLFFFSETAGKYCLVTISNTSLPCTSCPACPMGYFCPGGITMAQACPPGTVTPPLSRHL
jgi:hypothetical protein